MSIGERESQQIIYNVAGGLLKTVTPGQFAELGDWIKKAGFEGISALPLRVSEVVSLYRDYFPPVVLIENAWNPGRYDNLGLAVSEGIVGEVRRRLFRDKSEPPIVQDTLFYPEAVKCQQITDLLMRDNPQASFGSADFTDTYPGRTVYHYQSQFRSHSLTPEQILEIAERDQVKLVFDPTHLATTTQVSYPNRPTHVYSGGWEEQFMAVKRMIAGVDIHTANSQELADLLKGTGKLVELARAAFKLGSQLQFLRVETVIPIYMQVPLSPFQGRAVGYLGEMVEVLKKLRGEPKSY